MDDWLDRGNEGIEDKAGVLGAMGGMAALNYRGILDFMLLLFYSTQKIGRWYFGEREEGEVEW